MLARAHCCCAIYKAPRGALGVSKCMWKWLLFGGGEGGLAVVTYSRIAEKMIMTASKEKIFAMPSAKPRIIDSTPSLRLDTSC